ncbi:MAG: DUF294 nucleotidyltransferase-like domain-containing protein [Hydrogenophaga sp.]|uniref:DUF294 nucleotidyltransferase-like domain-containing protein n=1 Tax=Hydrogenophaga sp. TaxID=1904254 RepID=UPI00262A0A70|nr:DUF294 nucleotidyltransferase-like domain-containing protein [Hydrogenophaga sp.]MDM7941040.1 DUF294 nucleotidyltransferase-like domain-containing protein [Hydrogenophaga sp.]
MSPAHVQAFVAASRERSFVAGEVVVRPEDGPVAELYFIRSGAITGRRGLSDLAGGAFQYEAGELFPVSAVLARRAVTTRYSATEDSTVLALPADAMQKLAEASAVFGDFLNRRILRFLELSRSALQVAYASRTLAEQSLETPLAQLCRQAPETCLADTSLEDALTRMQALRIGSMLVVDAADVPVGILTRSDILARITLPRLPLSTPIGEVMAHPVLTLTHLHTAQDAALLMSSHGIRHVPVTRDKRAVGLVSERDLFALQRLSLKQVSSGLRNAPDVQGLQAGSQEIRRLARALLGQGVQAQQLTALISHLNDVLTSRLVEITAEKHGLDLNACSWIALGSEGRSEQTIATDQDNALILAEPPGAPVPDKQRWLAFAREVNEALDVCGYPLCKGNIMASNPDCCLTLGEWERRFADWIDRGTPKDLLNASIYFDFRSLVGQATLADRLRASVTRHAQGNPRFLRQMALNGLSQSAPLNWLGQIDTTAMDGLDTLDLKLQGTAIFVDVARLYALSKGVVATGTRERFEAVGPLLGVPEPEHQAWVGGFEFLQMLRLRAQLDGTAVGGNANRIAVNHLNDIDRRILKETLRVLRTLQQRVKLDYER